MTMHSSTVLPSADAAMPAESFPWSGLLALAAAGFITILTEALPAGLLPQMGAGLHVSPALVGQLVTVYALGSLLAAIPLTLMTQGMRRRPLLLIAIAGFAIVNTVTALSTHYTLTMVARFFAGGFAGLLWALLAGYAVRMVPEHQQGRAIAVAMVGTPLALSLGIPLGTFLGTALGWQYTFALMSGLTVALIGWVLVKVPDFSGQVAGKRISIRQALRLSGIKSVLFVTLTFVLAHNILYTYIAPFLESIGMLPQIGIVLLVFGCAALLGIWVTGVLIDRWLRRLVLISTGLFAVAALILGLWSTQIEAVYLGTVIWGLTFGGAATLFQTALAQTAGDAADVAQSMLVTVWNTAIAGGGILGGVLLGQVGAGSFAWALLILLVVTFGVVLRAKAHGFVSSADSFQSTNKDL